MVPPIVPGMNFNQVEMSATVNLIPQLVAYDVSRSGGGNIGLNNFEEFLTNHGNTPASGLPGCRKTSPDGKKDFTACDHNVAEYIWYAGNRQVINQVTYDVYKAQNRLNTECPVESKMRKDKGFICHTPIEFGVASIRSFNDVIKHASHGAVGALVIEPRDANISYPDPSSRLTADVTHADSKGDEKTFREFVVVIQDDLSLQQNQQAMPNHRMADDSEDSGQKGFNYRSEPLWARNGVFTSGADFNELNQLDYTNTLSSIAPNPGCHGACGDPETPVFHAKAGSHIRFRLLHPNGHPRQHAFALYGHNWEYQPWTKESTQIANYQENKEVQTALLGATGGFGPGRHFNIVTKAGGGGGIPGDYLFRMQENFQFHGGMWGILRVE